MRRCAPLWGPQGPRANRLTKLTKQKLLQIGVASAFATGMLTAVPSAQARITKIQILTRAMAFGAYSFFYQTFVPTINPPVIQSPYEDNPANGPIYPSFVPKTDSDGNDIAGIRLPELTVSLATYTGWGLRSGVWANDGCESSGQYIPFKATAADRMAAGDPRPSVQECWRR